MVCPSTVVTSPAGPSSAAHSQGPFDVVVINKVHVTRNSKIFATIETDRDLQGHFVRVEGVSEANWRIMGMRIKVQRWNRVQLLMTSTSRQKIFIPENALVGQAYLSEN